MSPPPPNSLPGNFDRLGGVSVELPPCTCAGGVLLVPGTALRAKRFIAILAILARRPTNPRLRLALLRLVQAQNGGPQRSFHHIPQVILYGQTVCCARQDRTLPSVTACCTRRANLRVATNGQIALCLYCTLPKEKQVGGEANRWQEPSDRKESCRRPHRFLSRACGEATRPPSQTSQAVAAARVVFPCLRRKQRSDRKADSQETGARRLESTCTTAKQVSAGAHHTAVRNALLAPAAARGPSA